MNRKEFLKVTWKLGIKPFLLVLVVLYCARFVIKAVTENENERLIAVLILGLSILWAANYLLSIVFSNIKRKIKSKLSAKQLRRLTIGQKALNFLIPISIAVYSYLYIQNLTLAALVLLPLIIISIRDFYFEIRKNIN